MKRVFLFLATNIAVLVVLGIVLQLLGVDSLLDEQGVDLDPLAHLEEIRGIHRRKEQRVQESLIGTDESLIRANVGTDVVVSSVAVVSAPDSPLSHAASRMTPTTTAATADLMKEERRRRLQIRNGLGSPGRHDPLARPAGPIPRAEHTNHRCLTGRHLVHPGSLRARDVLPYRLARPRDLLDPTSRAAM